MKGGRRLRRALPGLLLWLSAAGCEALVDGTLVQVRCLDEGKVGPPTCPLGYECKAGMCTPSVWGGLCSADADCSHGEICLDAAELGGAGPRRCSHPCCTSGDCDPDPTSVCWVPPVGGGSFCRPAADVGRVPGGTLGALAVCTSPGQCRSGRCAGGLCSDTCCSDTSCVVGKGTCRAGAPPHEEAPGFWCAPPAGSFGRYDDCKADADCASGLCLPYDGTLSKCSAPCCSSRDCEDLNGAPVRCVMLSGVHAGVRACGTDSGAGTGLVGEPCQAGSDCRSGMCLHLAGRLQCSDLCCSDADCGDMSAFACRPAILDSAWALRCEPK